MIWELDPLEGKRGTLWPRPPHDAKLNPYKPDGVKYFSLAQAASYTGHPAELLRRQWLQVFGPLTAVMRGGPLPITTPVPPPPARASGMTPASTLANRLSTIRAIAVDLMAELDAAIQRVREGGHA